MHRLTCKIFDFKGVIIFVLLFALILLSYNYAVMNKKLELTESVRKDNSNREGMMSFYNESENNYSVISKGKQFYILFSFDEHGLKSFWLQDDLSNKLLGCNFSEEGALTGYTYQDENYIGVTNLSRTPQNLVERYEWYKGYQTNYDFFSNGETKIHTEIYP